MVKQMQVTKDFAFPPGKMAFLTTLRNRYNYLLSPPIRLSLSPYTFHPIPIPIPIPISLNIYPNFSQNHCLSTDSTPPPPPPPEFAGLNAYDLLGVSQTSSFAEIKASFRKLAKQTHPDLLPHSTHHHPSSAAQRFVQILAAYEILSDSEKRAHYDQYLLSQRILIQRHSKQGLSMYKYECNTQITKKMEVVEWLKWYRYAINEILSEKRVVVGSSYFDVLERDFYSALHAAYYGPEIESMDLLPDCFEAEERSEYGTSEVLHLVSGRDLFGMVCIPDKVPQLSHMHKGKLISFASEGMGLCLRIEEASTQMNCGIADDFQMQTNSTEYQNSDSYKNLELHVAGRVVAVATRVPPNSFCNGIQNDDSDDHIHVYISSHEDLEYMHQGFPRDLSVDFNIGSTIHLGTIIGLGTSTEEGSCFVYNNCGVKTHVIMKHRTLLVKHMHWYQVGDTVSVCECRCSRARLPPSKFWLFEPRCGMHDIGGWYVETFGRDIKGRTVPSQRYWDGLDSSEQFEKRLHPAMYLLALAYRTLDIEQARREKRTMIDIVEGKMSRILSWCKEFV